MNSGKYFMHNQDLTYALTFKCCILRDEAANTNFNIFVSNSNEVNSLSAKSEKTSS